MKIDQIELTIEIERFYDTDKLNNLIKEFVNKLIENKVNVIKTCEIKGKWTGDKDEKEI